MAGKLHKGKDRRMIAKLQAVREAIRVRDLKALDLSKKTQALSNRTVIFDVTDIDVLNALTKVDDVLAAAMLANAP